MLAPGCACVKKSGVEGRGGGQGSSGVEVGVRVRKSSIGNCSASLLTSSVLYAIVDL